MGYQRTCPVSASMGNAAAEALSFGRASKSMTPRGFPSPMQYQAGDKPAVAIATATATDSTRYASVQTIQVTIATIGITTSDRRRRDLKLSRRIATRDDSSRARATRTGPITPHPKRMATIPRMPIDCPAEKLAQPASPTIRDTTGSMMNGARAERIGALVNPANLRKSDLTAASLRVSWRPTRRMRGRP